MPALSLTTLKQITNDLVKSVTGIKDVEKSAVVTLLDMCIKSHTTYLSAISKLTKKDKDKLSESIFTYLQNNNSKSAAAWSTYVRALTGGAKIAENKEMFTSLIGTHEVMKDVLTEIKKNINTIFGDSDTFAVIDMRKSHVAVIGAVISSMQLYRWSAYAFTYLSAVVDGTDSSIPKYREMYLANNVDDVIAVVNTCFGNKTFSFVKDIEVLRAKANDSVLTAGGMTNSKFFDPGTLTVLSVATFIGVAISSIAIAIAILRWLPERIDLLVHESYLQNKEMKEWMESRIAKLRMDLEQLDPNDPKYQRISRAIEVYDEKIRDLDRKIDAYLSE